jgi:hypothetical protein
MQKRSMTKPSTQRMSPTSRASVALERLRAAKRALLHNIMIVSRSFQTQTVGERNCEQSIGNWETSTVMMIIFLK